MFNPHQLHQHQQQQHQQQQQFQQHLRQLQHLFQQQPPPPPPPQPPPQHHVPHPHPHQHHHHQVQAQRAMAPQAPPAQRMVNLCQATQTTIIGPNHHMLQGAIMMQRMQGSMRGFAVAGQQYRQFYAAGPRNSILGPVPMGSMGVALKPPMMGFPPARQHFHPRGGRYYPNNTNPQPPAPNATPAHPADFVSAWQAADRKRDSEQRTAGNTDGQPATSATNDTVAEGATDGVPSSTEERTQASAEPTEEPVVKKQKTDGIEESSEKTNIGSDDDIVLISQYNNATEASAEPTEEPVVKKQKTDGIEESSEKTNIGTDDVILISQYNNATEESPSDDCILIEAGGSMAVSDVGEELEESRTAELKDTGVTGRSPSDKQNVESNIIDLEEAPEDKDASLASQDSQEDDMMEVTAEDVKEEAVEDVKEEAIEEAKEKTIEEAKEKTNEEAKEKTIEEAKEKTVEEAKVKTIEEAKEKTIEEAKEKTVEEAKEKTVEEAKEKTVEEAKEKTVEEAMEKTVEEAKKFHCYLCSITCHNQQNFQEHMIGLSHQQRMMEIQHMSNTCLVTLLPQVQESLRGACKDGEKGPGLQHRGATSNVLDHHCNKEHKEDDLAEQSSVASLEYLVEEEEGSEVEQEEGQRNDRIQSSSTRQGGWSSQTDGDLEDMASDEEYDTDTEYGSSFLIPVAGFLCHLCKRFYHFQSSGLHSHCKSLKHFENLKKYRSLHNQRATAEKVSSESTIATIASEDHLSSVSDTTTTDLDGSDNHIITDSSEVDVKSNNQFMQPTIDITRVRLPKDRQRKKKPATTSMPQSISTTATTSSSSTHPAFDPLTTMEQAVSQDCVAWESSSELCEEPQSQPVEAVEEATEQQIQEASVVPEEVAVPEKTVVPEMSAVPEKASTGKAKATNKRRSGRATSRR